MQEIRTGTMGWTYDDWRGPFYDAAAPASRLLTEYATVFSTVELDTTFYGAPRPKTLDSWVAQTPPGFLFSAKVPRAITHERRLVNAAESARWFADLMQDRLGPKLGALLLQLPPDFTADERPTLETFLDALLLRRDPAAPRWAVEFRSGSWASTDVAAALDARGVHVATTDRVDVGGPLRYLRLLGAEHSVARFDVRQIDRSEELTAWAARLDAARRAAPAGSPPLFAYIRNYYEGHSPASLAWLRTALGLPNAVPPGRQQMTLF